MSSAGTPVISSMARFQAMTVPDVSTTTVASGRKAMIPAEYPSVRSATLRMYVTRPPRPRSTRQLSTSLRRNTR